MISFYEKSAVQGYAPTENNLGLAYQSGFGSLDPDHDKARYWFEKAASKGYQKAQENLDKLNGKTDTQKAVTSPLLDTRVASAAARVNSEQTTKVASDHSNVEVADTRIGDNKNQSRLVIESLQPIDYSFTKDSTDSYILTLNNSTVSQKIITKLNNQIKKIAGFISIVKISQDNGHINLLIKLREQAIDVRKVQYKNKSALLVIDFIFKPLMSGENP